MFCHLRLGKKFLMRKIRAAQLPLLPAFHAGKLVRELQTMSDILDANPEIEVLIYRDLTREVAPDKGKEGLSAEQVYRALCIKQQNGYSYEDLAFHINNNVAYRRFCRLPMGQTVNKSSLQSDIQKVGPETLEQVNRILVAYADEVGIEKGRKVRTDCTTVETNIHAPTESTLLWDAVRVLTRLLKKARKRCPQVSLTDHTRAAKRRAFGIENAKGMKKRRPLYRKLLKVARRTVEYAKRAVQTLDALGQAKDLAEALQHYVELAEKVIDQTHRRVLENEKVPASEKILSIFEPHTDIIIKGDRKIEYGHKICLTGGASGMLIDCQILEGNPADSTMAVEMTKRVEEIYQRAARQVTFDGAFYSALNLADIKDSGVKDVVFAKYKGVEIEDMAKSPWVYKTLRKFRAGVEGLISFLKRANGLSRCTWRGALSFKSYVWSSIVAANLLTLARKLQT